MEHVHAGIEELGFPLRPPRRRVHASSPWS
jgi:hypothetical protein